MAKVTETTMKKPVRIEFRKGRTSADIYRSNDMPILTSSIENSVKWLAENYKHTDIDVIGEKPKCWDEYFNSNECK